MTTLLQITTSLFEHGESTGLARAFVTRWQRENPHGRVVVRDLARDPVPHLSAARFTAFTTPPGERSAAQIAEVALSDALIDELRAADVIVLGLPMYNFGVPSALKAYFDHVARAGVTFRYVDGRPEGLLTGKRTYVLAARGGVYAGTAADSQTGFVRTFLGFIGLDDVAFVYAEGLAMGAEPRAKALQRARAAAQQMASTATPAPSRQRTVHPSYTAVAGGAS